MNDLVGEALRNEVNRRKDLAKLYPAHATALLEGAEKARKVRDELGARRLKPLSQRMEDVKPPDKPGWPDLYVLYRICCLASHPGLRVWSRFKMVGSATVSFDPVDNKIFTPEQACWMVAASTLYLALYCICLAGIRNLKALDDWWNKVEPLLAQRE